MFLLKLYLNYARFIEQPLCDGVRQDQHSLSHFATLSWAKTHSALALQPQTARKAMG